MTTEKIARVHHKMDAKFGGQKVCCTQRAKKKINGKMRIWANKKQNKKMIQGLVIHSVWKNTGNSSKCD